MQKRNKRNLKERGITLIALVVTIVVLLILAGVSINTLFSDNGIINSASKSGDKYKMEAVRERVETVKVNWEAERIIDETVTVDKFWEELADADIRDRNGEIREKEKTTEDGVEKTKYEVDTKEGYVIDIIITDKNGKKDITIIDIEDGKKTLPEIKIKLTSTTNSITVKVVEARRIEGNLIYSYKLQEDKEYTEYKETIDKEVTIDNLIANKIYEIKVEGKNRNGTAKAEASQRTGELEKGTITANEPIWNNGTASITLSTTSGLTIQYQINSISAGGWKNYTSAGVTGLSHNTTVYARLTDGINYGEEASITIKDEKVPQEATVTFSGTTVEVNKEMTATVTLKDNESGINVSKSKWIFNQTSTAIGTAESSYTNTFTSATVTIKMTPTATGSWYLHILSVDNAGNPKETIKGVTVKVATWTQNKTIVTNGISTTYEVGDDYSYNCGVSSYTGGWKVLGAENGKLLIMSTVDIGTLTVNFGNVYSTGVSQLNNMCAQYGTNARSVKVEDINRVTGYDPTNIGDGKKYQAGKWDEYGNKVTYTASQRSATNGLTVTDRLDNDMFVHPDGRKIGTNGVNSITMESTSYEYEVATMLSNTSKAYNFLFGSNDKYFLANICTRTKEGNVVFGLRMCSFERIISFEMWTTAQSANNNSAHEYTSGVRAVVPIQ